MFSQLKRIIFPQTPKFWVRVFTLCSSVLSTVPVYLETATECVFAAASRIKARGAAHSKPLMHPV